MIGPKQRQGEPSAAFGQTKTPFRPGSGDKCNVGGVKDELNPGGMK